MDHTTKKVIVRTENAGVHFGTLVSKEGDEVVLNGARRIWNWKGANTCSELALSGLDPTSSRVAKPVDGHLIRGWIEILPCPHRADQDRAAVVPPAVGSREEAARVAERRARVRADAGGSREHPKR
jgi:hypothetical protein